MSPQNDRTTGTARPAFWYRKTLLERLASFGVTTQRLAELRSLITPNEEVTLQSHLNSAVFSLPERIAAQGFSTAKVTQAEKAATLELQRVTDWIVSLHRRTPILTEQPANDNTEVTEKPEPRQGVVHGGEKQEATL